MGNALHQVTKVALFALVLASCPKAWADVAQDLGLAVHDTAVGDKQPSLTIKPVAQVKVLAVELTRDGKTTHFGLQNVAADQEKSLQLTQDYGRFTYQVKLRVEWADQRREEEQLKLTLTRAKPLQLKLNSQDVRLDERRVRFSINNLPSRAIITLFGSESAKLDESEVDLSAKKADEMLEIAWKSPEQTVEYLELRVYDLSGQWKAVRLTPFQIEIPHEDVVFESGKWAILKDEVPKLRKTMTQVQEALKKHGTLLNLKLYIAGCTDTVGTKEANYQLSRNRARAIAAWFRSNGLKISILYHGFGEDLLAVKTPDETPEPRNRPGALYPVESGPAEGALQGGALDRARRQVGCSSCSWRLPPGPAGVRAIRR